MRPNKVETCHVALVFSLTPVRKELWELDFASLDWLFTIIYIICGFFLLPGSNVEETTTSLFYDDVTLTTNQNKMVASQPIIVDSTSWAKCISFALFVFFFDKGENIFLFNFVWKMPYQGKVGRRWDFWFLLLN